MGQQTILRVLGETLAQKDPSTQLHVMRTQVYAAGIARNMASCTRMMIRHIETAALLHDIGKVYIDRDILMKPGSLDAHEIEKMRQHPVTGADLAENLKMPREVVAGIRHHHERWDGGGYPAGRKGMDIPLVARVLAVADFYDAVTSARCYREPMPRKEAIELMRSRSGQHFDPDVLRIFLRYQTALEAEVADFESMPPMVFAAQLDAVAHSEA